MAHKAAHLIAFAAITLALVSCQVQESPPPTDAPAPIETLPPEQVLALGDVAGDPAWSIEHFQPLADYLANNLADLGIQQGRIIVTSDLETMMAYLESGQVDLYFDSPYPALEVYENVGAQPLARRWKSGVAEYHSLIVVRRDSGITTLSGLAGQSLAFDHPASTSGYLLPKAFLAAGGFQTNEKNDFGSAVADDEIGYVFAYGEENQITWVLEGKIVGAAISSDDYEGLCTEDREQLTVLARTPAVPRHIALARPGMDDALQARLTELLLELDETPEGAEILETFENTSQFDALPLGSEGTIQALEELFAPVR